MSILELLGIVASAEPARPATRAETETVRRIVERLDHLPPDEARYIAAFAYLLSRVARADMDVSPGETRAMERIVMTHGNLAEDQAILVVQIAKSQNLLFGGTENYLVTREFGRVATREQKLALLDCLFAVSAADSSITSIEDNVVRQIANELRLEHVDFIEARRRFREHLEVLREPPRQDGG